MNDDTRLFFVVDSVSSNEEIYTTLENAETAYNQELQEDKTARLYIAMVRNAYNQSNGLEMEDWNYSDHSDTFEIIKILKQL